MALSKANQVRIFIDDAGTLKPLGHARDNSLSFGADEIDVSTKDTEEGQADFIDGTKTTDFSFNGYIDETDAVSIGNLFDYWKAGALLNLVFTDSVSGHSQFAFAARVFQLEENSAGNAGPVEYSGSGKAVGPVTRTTIL